MRVLVSGATGFLGRHLIQKLLSDDYQISVVTRNPDTAAKTLPGNI
ncbi:MAG: NAD-dependent epimerase/dehydratase family protein, partial [Clostridia bacterium]|nr:NAD-dependent epimerase/dehydratase family protein [Clostridia bacterium]